MEGVVTILQIIPKVLDEDWSYDQNLPFKYIVEYIDGYGTPIRVCLSTKNECIIHKLIIIWNSYCKYSKYKLIK